MPSNSAISTTDPPAGLERRVLWIQNAISIRHADAIDVKFELSSGPDRAFKVVALGHLTCSR